MNYLVDAVGELWHWVRGRRRRLRVQGDSMAPTLVDGQFVLFDPARTAVVGDVVVCKHPSQPIAIVKRAASVDPVGLVELASDNEQEGTDSRSFGRVDIDHVFGVVTISLEWPFPEVGRR